MSDEDNADAPWDIPRFIRWAGISRTLFYDLVARGEGPRLMKVGKLTKISAAARREWIIARERPPSKRKPRK